MSRAARTGAALALAGVVASGLAIALAGAAADDGYLVPALVRAPAGWIDGPLAGIAIPTPLRVAFAELALMALAYAAAVVLAPRLRARWVVAAVVAGHVVAALAPPLLSTDVFNYVDAARLQALYHLDPYVSPPAAERGDALYAFVHWRHVVSVYGPAFTLGTRPVGAMSPAAGIWAMKALAALAGVGCAGLVAWIARHRGLQPARALAAFGLNPVVLVWSVGGAHNDLLMLLALLAGVALVLTARPVRAGALLAVAAAVKLSAGVAIPFLAVGMRRRGALLFGGALLGGGAIAGAGALAFGHHELAMIPALQRQQQLTDIASLPRGLAYALGQPQVTPQDRTILHVVLAVWLAGWLIHALRGGDPLSAAGWALLGVVASSTWLLPWYATWPLALGAAAGNRRLLIATSALALSYVVGHVPLN